MVPGIEPHEDGTVITVWAVPGAGRTGVAGEHDGALRVRVSAPAESGKANAALERVVGRAFGLRRAQLIRGATSRRKWFLLPGIDVDDAAARVAVLLAGVRE